ncbi:MAG: hypothetical protein CMH32_02015 [Micavibrio sp.]|nr:hypothetical protein [Micavibrio sp.]|tara:strand:+ start:320 stop:565 length:246 start_codon:yes stop_codon:yes gene_type:complete
MLGTKERADVWGEYNVPFYQDTNGNSCVPAELEDIPFHSTMKTNDGDDVLKTGQINWDIIFPQPKEPAAKLSGPNKAKGPL